MVPCKNMSERIIPIKIHKVNIQHTFMVLPGGGDETSQTLAHTSVVEFGSPLMTFDRSSGGSAMIAATVLSFLIIVSLRSGSEASTVRSITRMDASTATVDRRFVPSRSD